MSAEQTLLDNGYEETKYLSYYSYDDALIGVTYDGRTVYDYDRMVDWLMLTECFSEEDAREWVDYNTLRALPYMGDDGPIVIFQFGGKE